MNLDGVFLDGGMSGMDWTVCDLDGGGLDGIRSLCLAQTGW